MCPTYWWLAMSTFIRFQAPLVQAIAWHQAITRTNDHLLTNWVLTNKSEWNLNRNTLTSFFRKYLWNVACTIPIIMFGIRGMTWPFTCYVLYFYMPRKLLLIKAPSRVVSLYNKILVLASVVFSCEFDWPWWRHQMETFSALLSFCAGTSPVTGEFPALRPVTRSFGVFFDLCLNKRLSKQWWGWWFETPSCPLWRHRNDYFNSEEGDATIYKLFSVY